VAISATGATGGVGVATFLTVIDFTSGTGVVFLGGDTDANLALAAGVGLGAAATAFGAADTAALVLTAGTLEGTTAVFGDLLVLAEGAATLVFAAAGRTASIAVFALSALLLDAVFLAETDLEVVAALATVALAGAATFFFGVVTSCLLAV
jgi:hypothetical protein